MALLQLLLTITTAVLSVSSKSWFSVTRHFLTQGGEKSNFVLFFSELLSGSFPSSTFSGVNKTVMFFNIEILFQTKADHDLFKIMSVHHAHFQEGPVYSYSHFYTWQV